MLYQVREVGCIAEVWNWRPEEHSQLDQPGIDFLFACPIVVAIAAAVTTTTDTIITTAASATAATTTTTNNNMTASSSAAQWVCMCNDSTGNRDFV